MRLIGGLLGHGRRGPVAATELTAMAVRAGAEHARTFLDGSLGLFGVESEPFRSDTDIALVADLDLLDLADLRARTGADTPGAILSALYRQQGASFIAGLRGGFALAIWDARQRCLILAVDHLGIGRLSYADTAEAMVFASRATALTAIPCVDGVVDPTAVFRYLNFGYVPAPGSIYQGVRRLPPGSLLRVQDGRTRVESYWDIPYRETARPRAALASEIYRHTEAAVARAMTLGSSKSMGAFLSGGTDSSAVVGLMSRLSGERVNTFSIGFAEERYNELDYAELSARHFGAAPYTHVITAAEAFDVLPRLVQAYDEPFGNDSVIGTLCCARLAAEAGVSRLLAGDGGDEIFGGNERYRTDAIFARYQRIPAALRRHVIEPALRGSSGEGRSVLARARRYVSRATIANPARFYSYEFFIAQNAAAFLEPDFLAATAPRALEEVLEGHWQRASGTAELNRLLYLDLKLTIGDNDLYKVTRTAEVAGLRVAFPLLDVPLVEFMATVSARDKVRGLDKRFIFKRAFRDLLPPATLAKRKHGFGVPVSTWLRTDRQFAELAQDSLRASHAYTRQWLRPEAVDDLFRLHANEATPYYGSFLWTILMLELWHREDVTRRQPA